MVESDSFRSTGLFTKPLQFIFLVVISSTIAADDYLYDMLNAGAAIVMAFTSYVFFRFLCKEDDVYRSMLPVVFFMDIINSTMILMEISLISFATMYDIDVSLKLSC
jgi:hypothetical protein